MTTHLGERYAPKQPGAIALRFQQAAAALPPAEAQLLKNIEAMQTQAAGLVREFAQRGLVDERRALPAQGFSERVARKPAGQSAGMRYDN